MAPYTFFVSAYIPRLFWIVTAYVAGRATESWYHAGNKTKKEFNEKKARANFRRRVRRHNSRTMQYQFCGTRGSSGLSFNELFAPGRKGSEPRLIHAAQRGDREAFDALARLHAAPLRGFLVQRVGPDAAEDVLQETWLAGWSALGSFGGKSRFKAWLYAIAMHKCHDYRRSQRRSQVEELTEEMPGLPQAEDAYAASDRAHAVRAALAELPEPQQEVLDLYFYAELTLPEIAQMLQRNLNTVKYQFYRAHAQAALALQEYAP